MVTGCPDVRLTPYMGAVVLYVVLHSLEGVWLSGLHSSGFCGLGFLSAAANAGTAAVFDVNAGTAAVFDVVVVVVTVFFSDEKEGCLGIAGTAALAGFVFIAGFSL
jgi:hypothetical protein